MSKIVEPWQQAPYQINGMKLSHDHHSCRFSQPLRWVSRTRVPASVPVIYEFLENYPERETTPRIGFHSQVSRRSPLGSVVQKMIGEGGGVRT